MTSGGARSATPEDVDEICMALPEVELGVSWGHLPTYKVRGKGFLLRRPPHNTAVDPETGELFDDLLVVGTANAADKEALVADERLPFFTIDHMKSYNAVLVQESRLSEIERDELAEIITDAWASRAPKRLAREYLGQPSGQLADG